jgi:rubrerythrin
MNNDLLAVRPQSCPVCGPHQMLLHMGHREDVIEGGIYARIPIPVIAHKYMCLVCGTILESYEISPIKRGEF